MSHFEAAVRQQQYELVALRLVLGVVNALEASAPAAREELVALLSFEAPAAAPRMRNSAPGRARRGRSPGPERA